MMLCDPYCDPAYYCEPTMYHPYQIGVMTAMHQDMEAMRKETEAMHQEVEAMRKEMDAMHKETEAMRAKMGNMMNIIRNSGARKAVESLTERVDGLAADIQRAHYASQEGFDDTTRRITKINHRVAAAEAALANKQAEKETTKKKKTKKKTKKTTVTQTTTTETADVEVSPAQRDADARQEEAIVRAMVCQLRPLDEFIRILAQGLRCHLDYGGIDVSYQPTDAYRKAVRAATTHSDALYMTAKKKAATTHSDALYMTAKKKADPEAHRGPPDPPLLKELCESLLRGREPPAAVAKILEAIKANLKNGTVAIKDLVKANAAFQAYSDAHSEFSATQDLVEQDAESP